MRKSVNPDAAEQMRRLIVKALGDRGVAIPERHQKSGDFGAIAKELLPSTCKGTAATRLRRIVTGKTYFSPRNRDYLHACKMLGIDPDAVDFSPRGRDEMEVAKVKRGTLGYVRAQGRFRRKVVIAFDGLGIPSPQETNSWYKSKAGRMLIEGLGAFRRSDKVLLTRFFLYGERIDPAYPLYWRLCRELGIGPDESGFEYELKEGVDVDKL